MSFLTNIFGRGTEFDKTITKPAVCRGYSIEYDHGWGLSDDGKPINPAIYTGVDAILIISLPVVLVVAKSRMENAIIRVTSMEKIKSSPDRIGAFLKGSY